MNLIKMSKDDNLIHKKVGELFKKAIPSNSEFTLLLDSACGGNQRIPLFCNSKKSRQTEFCSVDLLILKRNKIKAIVEIEESNIKPTQTCGKFLTSAISRYYIHGSQTNKPIEMSDSVLFIQIVDTSRLVSGKTAKFKQSKAIEASINEILPVKGSQIKQYRLLTTDEMERLDSVIRESLAPVI